MVVVDTNVVAYLLIAGDKTKAAQELFARDGDWHSEPFALVELSNLLATACRSRSFAVSRARSLLAAAEELLRGGMHAISHQTALAFANEFAISAYDARFIAVADQLDTPLVTEDARLRAAVGERARSLAEAVAAMRR